MRGGFRDPGQLLATNRSMNISSPDLVIGMNLWQTAACAALA